MACADSKFTESSSYRREEPGWVGGSGDGLKGVVGELGDREG